MMNPWSSVPLLDHAAVRHIILHTAADARDHGLRDTTAEEIHQWHLNRGWVGIGYHFVIRHSGLVEAGRPIDRRGAHVQGLNHLSIGICFSGHGDLEPLTDHQKFAAACVCAQICYSLSLTPNAIIGHRDAYQILRRPALKSCPGKHVYPAHIIHRVQAILDAALNTNGTSPRQPRQGPPVQPE